MKVFQYLVFWTPTEKQKEDGQVAKIIADVKTTLGDTEQAVLIQAATEIPTEYKSQLSQVQIVVRPF